MALLARILLTALAAFGLAHFLEGLAIADWQAAVIFSIVLGLVNTFIRPLLVIITIPATVLTLGLFLLVINALMIMLADYLLDGFSVTSFWWALGFSILLSVAHWGYSEPQNISPSNQTPAYWYLQVHECAPTIGIVNQY